MWKTSYNSLHNARATMLFISPLFIGLLAAAGALLTELFVFSFAIQDTATQSVSTTNVNFVFVSGGLGFLFLSAFIEESFKYFLLKKTLVLTHASWYIIAFLFLFSLGFSGLEITLLLFTNPLINAAVFAHIIGLFLLHLLTISLFGYILAHPSLKRFALLFIPLATLIHFLYNVAILYQDTLHI